MKQYEKVKEILIEQIKEKSILDIAYEYKKIDEFKDKSMNEIVEMLESEVEEE